MTSEMVIQAPTNRGPSTTTTHDNRDDIVAGLPDEGAPDVLLRQAVLEARPWLWIMAVTAVALAGVETAFPAVLGRAIDSIIGHGATRLWVWCCAALVGVMVATDVIDDLASGAMTAGSTAWLRRGLVGHLLRLSPSTDRLAEGDVVNRVVANTADVGRIGSDLLRAAVNIVPVLGGIIALGLINVWLLATFVIGLPVALLILRAFARDSSEAAAKYLQEQGRIASSLAEAMAGARTIAVAGTQDYEFNRILSPLPGLHRAGLAMWRAQTKALSNDALLVPLLEVAVLAVAGLQLSRGKISAGEMLAASQYVVLAAGFSSALTAVQRLARSRAASARVSEILSEPAMTYGKRRLPKGDGRLQFRSVTVRADQEVILDRIDLDLPAGILIAVVGPSGSGKSVLTGLIGRLVDPDEGEVVLDGVAVRDLSRDALRKAVTYAFERPALVGATVREAIEFGARKPRAGELERAVAAARADTFIEHMPAGYLTPLSEAAMSGGEAQRLGLARAFAHIGRVIVLDDVASRLDTVTEHQITEVLTDPELRQTRVVVARRASTAARADLVVWLDGGRVQATGTHRELWLNRGYRRIFEPVHSSRRLASENGLSGAAR